MLTRGLERIVLSLLSRAPIAAIVSCPWEGHGYGLAGAARRGVAAPARRIRPPFLYSPEERRRRDSTGWTMVQGVLAPIQFAIFAASLILVLHFLATGQNLALATDSVLAKTAALAAIMTTGAIWEHEVFGVWLFARPFFWEDVFSLLVVGLHTAYVITLLTGAVGPHGQMLIALAAYTAYVINATQFVLKLRAARLEKPILPAGGVAG